MFIFIVASEIALMAISSAKACIESSQWFYCSTSIMRLLRKILNNIGEIMDPCGTPLLMWIIFFPSMEVLYWDSRSVTILRVLLLMLLYLSASIMCL